ncbi:MAG TPA: DUF1345 domain-containing protein [Acidimicrobiales bacterium]|nr:DUF1345 domain-containing protein [Acidimicrobiales bacterium]
MVIAVLIAGALRTTLPDSLRADDAPWLLGGFVVVALILLIIGDPGRIDRQAAWLRVVTMIVIAMITIANGASVVKLSAEIINREPSTNSATTLLGAGAVIWATNVIAFGLWYWELDRGGAAARAHGQGDPAFVFPEMTNPDYVTADWFPKVIDFLYLSFNTSMAFSPTDVSAVRPWAKLLMMAEEAVSVIVAVLVIARAVSLLT